MLHQLLFYHNLDSIKINLFYTKANGEVLDLIECLVNLIAKGALASWPK